MLFSPQVLVASCHPQHCKPLVVVLDAMNLKVALAFSAREAVETLTANEILLVCCGAELPDGDYRTILSLIASRNLKTKLLVMTAAEECAEYLEGMQLGAFDILPSRCQKGEFEWIVRDALGMLKTGKAVRAAGKSALVICKERAIFMPAFGPADCGSGQETTRVKRSLDVSAESVE